MNVKKICLIGCIISFTLLSLTGCLYPTEKRTENLVPLETQLEQVQHSVDQYQERTGVLPLVNREADTPIYEKYVIDFHKLVPMYLERPPANSFEQGGIFQYVLVNVEDNPTVKLLDLRMTSDIRDVQIRLNQYLSKHDWLPWKEMFEGGFFSLDYEKLKINREPLVESPFTRQPLPLVVDQYGQVGVDYRPDLYRLLENDQLSGVVQDEDIRFLLVEDSHFVPAHSFPITLKNEELVFIRD